MKVYDSIINKIKILCIFALILVGCQNKPQYYLYVYYASTCPVCRSFINNVIPELEETYGSDMLITTLNIDEEENIEAYVKTCSLLEDYNVDDNSGSVPFIVLDGYFAKVGYDITQKADIIETIEDAINGKDVLGRFDDMYSFMRDKSYHEEV